MRRWLAAFVLAAALLAGPAAAAQSPDPGVVASEATPSKPWIRLVFFIPAAAGIGVGAVVARRRFRGDA